MKLTIILLLAIAIFLHLGLAIRLNQGGGAPPPGGVTPAPTGDPPSGQKVWLNRRGCTKKRVTPAPAGNK